MKQQSKRVPTQVHTRELDRSVAHHNMARAKLKRVNKDDASFVKNPFGGITKVSKGSYFSNHWRDYINTKTIDLRRNTK